ncbi:MAG: hypothetical protein KAY82_02230 [Hylemonella sp.]|nr:hypothetical protein [Hylemonella sp.]
MRTTSLFFRLGLAWIFVLFSLSAWSQSWSLIDSGLGVLDVYSTPPSILERDRSEWFQDDLYTKNLPKSPSGRSPQFNFWIVGPRPDTFRDNYGFQIYGVKYQLTRDGVSGPKSDFSSFSDEGWFTYNLDTYPGSHRVDVWLYNRQTGAETLLKSLTYKMTLGTEPVAPTTTTSTINPEGGWWWNPSESGAGYNIEIQNNVIAFAAYVYGPDGAPIYYISAGAMTGDRKYSGSLDRVSNGQCMGCAYKPPVRASVGTVVLEFDTATTARLYLNGASAIPVQRFSFGVNSEAPGSLLGEWALVSGSSDNAVYEGDRISFSSTQTVSGTLSAVGNRSGATERIAVAYKDSASNSVALLVDTSTSYYDFYLFTFSGLNAIEGKAWTFLKTASLSGPGSPFMGFRSKSAALVSTGLGPGMSSASPTRWLPWAMPASTASSVPFGDIADTMMKNLRNMLAGN